MTGNYGGEVLRQVRAFKPEESLPGLFDPGMRLYVDRARETYASFGKDHPVSFAAFKQGPWYHHGVLALEQTQLAMRSPFLDNEFIRTAYRAPASVFRSSEVSLRLIADGMPALLHIPTDRGLAGTGSALSKATSRSVLELLFKAEYAYDMGMPQWMARADHVLSPLRLENIFLGRHKIFHFRTWYRDVLSGYIRDMLLDSRSLSRPYIKRNAAESVVRGHIKGNRNYTNELHRLLSLELLHRLFLDGGESRNSG